MQWGRFPKVPFTMPTGPTRIWMPRAMAPRQMTEAASETGCGENGYLCGWPHGQSWPATGSSRSTVS